jgi:hypothetical protein
MGTNAGDSSSQWAGAFVTCDAAKTWPGSAKFAKAEAAGNTLDVDVDQQLLGKSACGNNLPNLPLPNVPLPDDVGVQ